MYGISTKQNIYILSYTIKPKTSQQKEKKEKKLTYENIKLIKLNKKWYQLANERKRVRSKQQQQKQQKKKKKWQHKTTTAANNN